MRDWRLYVRTLRRACRPFSSRRAAARVAPLLRRPVFRSPGDPFVRSCIPSTARLSLSWIPAHASCIGVSRLRRAVPFLVGSRYDFDARCVMAWRQQSHSWSWFSSHAPYALNLSRARTLGVDQTWRQEIRICCCCCREQCVNSFLCDSAIVLSNYCKNSILVTLAHDRPFISFWILQCSRCPNAYQRVLLSVSKAA